MKGAIIKASCGQGMLFPSIEAATSMACSAWRVGREEEWTHTTVRASFSLGLHHGWKKVKAWQARVGLWALVTEEENSERKLQNRSFG